MSAILRVGHKGADLIAPGNTIASFDAALAAGVDMIEFDVLPDRHSGELILAHDPDAALETTPPTLDEGLAHLAASPFDGVDFDVDLKAPGYERRVVDALRAHGLVERALVSSQYRQSLAIVRAIEPALRLGWSVPRASTDYTKSRLLGPPVLLLLRVYARLLPMRAARAIRRGHCDALMAHWAVVTRRLIEAVSAVGGELYVWTVDDLARMRSLAELGVTGVITNDPRLFAALASAPGT